jgi:hypothetical protein
LKLFDFSLVDVASINAPAHGNNVDTGVRGPLYSLKLCMY